MNGDALSDIREARMEGARIIAVSYYDSLPGSILFKVTL